MPPDAADAATKPMHRTLRKPDLVSWRSKLMSDVTRRWQEMDRPSLALWRFSVAIMAVLALCGVLVVLIAGGPSWKALVLALLGALAGAMCVIAAGSWSHRVPHVSEPNASASSGSGVSHQSGSPRALIGDGFELACVGHVHTSAADGRFLRVNRRFCDMTGYSEPELLSMTFPQITHHDDRQVEADLGQRLVQGSAPNSSLEVRMIRKSGEALWVDVETSLSRDSSGCSQAVSIIADITKRKRAEED